MGPPFSQERMTSNSFAVCFESWAPPVLKSGRFAGAFGSIWRGGGGCPLFPQQLVIPPPCIFCLLSHGPTPPRPSQTLVLAQHGISSIPDLLERGGPGPSPYSFLLIPSTHAALTKLGMEQAPEICTCSLTSCCERMMS